MSDRNPVEPRYQVGQAAISLLSIPLIMPTCQPLYIEMRVEDWDFVFS